MPQRNWKRVPIKELYSGFWDGPHATPKQADSGPIYLGIKNISEDGHLDFSDVRHIAEEDFSKWIKRVEPKPGDIVFTYEATLHRYAIIPKGFRGCLGRRLALIRTNPDAVETKFLYYYFFGKEWRNTVSKYIMSGATVDRIPIIHFPKFEVNLPLSLSSAKSRTCSPPTMTWSKSTRAASVFWSKWRSPSTVSGLGRWM